MKESFKRYGFIYKSVSLFLYIILFSSLYFTLDPATNIWGEEVSYISTLVRSANKRELYKDKYWHTLLHYKHGLLGLRSLIDDPAFFLAKDGKYNPKSELEATLRSFFDPVSDESTPTVCRFIARYSWLKEKLDIDESMLPTLKCEEFKKVIETVKPKSATLIFPASYMNSPASMFGHTLLTIETENNSKLLSHAVNYSAYTGESFGPFFAIKGIFGLYRGYFSVLPYYEKVQEYNNVNQRDIWEYRLNLTEDEVVRLIMHLYELEDIYSRYFFFDENCSYCLLFLLDAARPSLNLTDNISPWIAPVETIRDVMESELIVETIYRPSKATKIRHIASLLSNKNKKLALSIIDQEVEPKIIFKQDISIEEKINICDLAKEHLQYQYAKKKIEKEEYTDLFLNMMNIRSKLGRPNKDRYKVPVPSQPLHGHKSNRFCIGGGIRDEEFFQEIKWRAAYHDLLAPDTGYLPGSQIQFCNVVLRYLYDEKKVRLEKLDFVDIISITAINKFFKPLSWKVNTGLSQKEMRDEDEHLVYHINGGAGYALENRYIGIFYAMMEADLNFGRSLEKKSAIGLGGTIGILNNITGFWKVYLYVRDIYYGLGDKHNELEIALQQNFKITINNSIGFEVLRRMAFDSHQDEGKLYWNIFY